MSLEREEYVSWRGKNADPKKHGGVRAASFVCGKIIQLRAPTADVGYVPNAKYLAHIPHQTLKTHFIRCAKPKKFYNI